MVTTFFWNFYWFTDNLQNNLVQSKSSKILVYFINFFVNSSIFLVIAIKGSIKEGSYEKNYTAGFIISIG